MEKHIDGEMEVQRKRSKLCKGNKIGGDKTILFEWLQVNS